MSAYIMNNHLWKGSQLYKQSLMYFCLPKFCSYTLSRVLEKQERMEATVMALKAQHGDEAAEEAAKDLEELVTEADREQLKKLKVTLNKYVYQSINTIHVQYNTS